MMRVEQPDAGAPNAHQGRPLAGSRRARSSSHAPTAAKAVPSEYIRASTDRNAWNGLIATSIATTRANQRRPASESSPTAEARYSSPANRPIATTVSTPNRIENPRNDATDSPQTAIQPFKSV